MITIVGGSGFIGTRLARLFQSNGLDFQIVDKRVSKSFPDRTKVIDIRDRNALSKGLKGTTVIVNLAAEHRDDVSPKSLYDEVNVEGSRNVCSAAEANNVNTIVFTSSVAIYGFAPLGTDESGTPNPFNDYGRTKYEAEGIYSNWYSQDVDARRLIILRPTVVFGEGNRGNVFNLLKQIASGKFAMIGNGQNVKSMAYVENIVSFIQFSLSFSTGKHCYNYIDKPDFSMNQLVENVCDILRTKKKNLRVPYAIGYIVGGAFDLASKITSQKFAISRIRVKKFCSNSMFNSSISTTGFVAPVSLEEALRKTVTYEFIENNKDKEVFYTE
ncbi:MAG: NAD-dependent epimerase/dehydratase family protein [Pseudohongiellaceae bacterium]|nr:NAD-dependent epimerase/dehydratase family protein [Pseudohongiellaceae bacterium]